MSRGQIRRFLLLTITLFAVMGLVGCSVINDELPTYEESSIVVEGDIAPNFTTTTLEGESVTLSSLRGGAVLLIFFTHTCPDCKALFDDLAQKQPEIEALGVRVLAVSRGGSQADIEAYMAKNGYAFDAVADAEAQIYRLYATAYVPRCYLINASGVVDAVAIEYEASHILRLLERMKLL